MGLLYLFFLVYFLSPEFPSIDPANGTLLIVILPNDFNFSCNATGFPPPTISWTFSPSRSSNNASIPLSEDLFMNTVFSESALSVVNIIPSDQSQSGVYTCRARNSLGEANRSTTVLVTGESLLHQFNVRKIAHAVFFC